MNFNPLKKQNVIWFKITCKLALKKIRLGVLSLFDPFGCGKNLRVLQEKLDALRVQTEHSPTKYQCFEQIPRTLLHNSVFYFISPWNFFLRLIHNIQELFPKFGHVFSWFVIFKVLNEFLAIKKSKMLYNSK